MQRLTPDDFQLRAIGTLIYARTWSSPVLTASSPEIAEEICGWLNDYAAIKVKVEAGGPVLVTPRGFDGTFL